MSVIPTMSRSSASLPLSQREAVKMSLWSIWLSGFLLICLSIYATQLLNFANIEITNRKFYHNKDSADSQSRPSITIFSAPSPFNGSVGQKQALAVRSWLGLSPNINVVLFGNDPSVQSFCAGFGSRVLFEPDIDFSFLNTPFFHSMVARAEASSSDISVLVHPEAIILPDFISTLNQVYTLDHDWFLVSCSTRVSSFSFYLDEAGQRWIKDDGQAISSQMLQEALGNTRQWDCSEGRLLMAWNNNELPLHMGVLPPFLYGKGIHNRWLINEVHQSKYRFVFDASWVVSNFYLDDSNDHDTIQFAGNSNLHDIRKPDWEYNGNYRLGEMYGLLSSQEVSYSDFVKLIMCGEQLIFVDHEQNVVYPAGERSSNSLWKKNILLHRREKKLRNCLAHITSPLKLVESSPWNNMSLSEPLHLPFNMERLLHMTVDKNRTVVLAIAGYSYKDMLMSWVCRMRHLKIQNFVVCALDDETYEFSILQGLPVFKDSFAPKNISFNDCHFGTKCFQKVTKTKSRMVLQILKLGYNVLLSDVDVYWFRNPIPLLQTYGSSVLAVQSDEFNLTVPINLPRRSNSGFYFAQSDGSTISALEKVVKHAMTSELSEQPSFYDNLCGPNGSFRVGHDRCLEPETNLTVQFLDRDLFPNGAYRALWEEQDVGATCAKIGSYVLHNNWISGRMRKLERQLRTGLWDYDSSSRMCFMNWQRKNTSEFAEDIDRLVHELAVDTSI